MNTYRPLLAGVAVVALALAGCSEAAAPNPGDEGLTVRLYGTDPTMQNSFPDELADRSVVSGMKGTAPLNPLPAEFVNRMREVDPELEDFIFAGETYDAIVISALAAELAGTPEPEVVRSYINSVTIGGEQCTVVADCLALARAGRQLEYRGVALQRGGFTDQGEPAMATYATRHFGPDGFIDDAKTEFVGAGDPAAVTSTEPPEPRRPAAGVEPLTIGGLLPLTGGLAFAYPPLAAAVTLALDDINDAGGVFGVDVEWVEGDDGTDPEVARETLASHIEEGVHIIIGAAASGVTEAVLADAVAAKRILFSPSNTAASLSNVDDDGYYFRTAPSDLLQGAALADVILRDGVERIVVVARDDAYGRGIMGNTRDALVRFGVPTADLQELIYALPAEEGAPIPGLDELVEEVIAARPDGVLVIGFSEAAQVIQQLIDGGVTLGPRSGVGGVA